MNYENILLEKKNSIAYVTVNRPKVLNALNMATMEELRAAFHDIKKMTAIRVVIFTGVGREGFIAGADIGELAKQDAVTGRNTRIAARTVLNLIENLGKPVIACINGFALGGGCEIAHGLHHASGQRECEARAAGGEAGDHPGIRRDAAAAATRRQGNRHADGAGRGNDHGARGASHRAGE